jgi:hypothetical protein
VPPLVSVVVPDEEFEDGDTFDAEVRIENAERIAAFSFRLLFDPEHLTVPDQDANVDGVQFGSAIGDFLTQGERADVIQCDVPSVDAENQVNVACITNAPAVCQGGPEGSSGEGTLAIVPFEVVDQGDTELNFDPEWTSVVLDDFSPCESGEPIQVPAQTEGTTVRVKSDSLPWLLIAGVAAVIIAIVGAGGYAYYRSRQRTTGEA